MKFLQSLIKESASSAVQSPKVLTEEEKRVKPDHVYGKIGEFALLVKWLEIDNYEEINREWDDDTSYVEYAGTINNIVVTVRRGDEEYFVEVYPADPIESDDKNPSWVQSADVWVFTSVPGGNFPRSAVDKQDPELDALIDKLVRGFLANNWTKLLDDVFTKEEEVQRRRRGNGGYARNNDDLADY